MFYTIFFMLIIGYVLILLTISIFNMDSYNQNLQLLRKGLYVIFVLSIAIGGIFGVIDITDWKTLGILGVIIVFIDISVLLTPDIQKIWQAEFTQTDNVKRIVRKNKEIIEYNSKKVECFADVISETSNYFDGKSIPNSWEAYEGQLKEYLFMYTNTFKINLVFFRFERSDNIELNSAHLSDTFRKVEQCFNIHIEDNSFREEVLSSLNNGEIFELRREKKPTTSVDENRKYLIPCFGEKYNFFACITPTIVNIDGIDNANIINLIQIFDWYMVA